MDDLHVALGRLASALGLQQNSGNTATALTSGYTLSRATTLERTLGVLNAERLRVTARPSHCRSLVAFQ